jgi:S-formylglutathione hydrolase FrmB
MRIGVAGSAPSVLASGRTLTFEVTLDKSVASEPITGRLLVFLTQRKGRQPINSPDWFHTEPFFGVDVQQFEPGQSVIVDDSADGFPGKLSKLPAGEYRAQGLLDHDFYNPFPAAGVGNFFSKEVALNHDPQSSGPVSLSLTEVVKAPRFVKSKWVKEVVRQSELLSEFHGRDIDEMAAVVLPADYYDRPAKRYPVIYVVPGFGGSHLHNARRYANSPPEVGAGEIEFIRVLLSGQCKWGHHVYADSATNGPRGAALITEMIPHIDRTYRTIAASTARFVTGHSSGGWSSLWLQVTYPDTFGGLWSTAPDPIDLRDFQQIDVYHNPPLSLFFDEQGDRRPLARRGTTPIQWFQPFSRMEDVLGRGGQLRSFEAVFSPLDDRGLPAKLWDRQTGRLDPRVAKAWQKYDIRLILKKRWSTLKCKLRGKLHITAGEFDTFYLEGAVEKTAATLRALGGDAKIEIVPGADHGSFMSKERIQQHRREMSALFLKHHSQIVAMNSSTSSSACNDAKRRWCAKFKRRK